MRETNREGTTEKGKAKATVEVKITDVSGNSETKKVKVTLVPKGGKKK